MQSDLISITSEQAASSMLPPATGSSNINVEPTERIISTFLGAASAVYGFRHLKSLGGMVLAATGSYLLLRGTTGYCSINNALGRNAVSKKNNAMEVNGTLTINKPRAEVYAFWRRLENLPLFMKHLEEVKLEDSVRSTWKAKLPGGVGTVTWESVITEDKAGELIAWASIPGSTIDNAGEVSFTDAPNQRGTIVKANITYRLPAGDIGNLAGKLFNPVVESMIKGDLRRFKSIIETGEIPLPQDKFLKPEEDQAKEKTSTKQSRKKRAASFDQGSALSSNEPFEKDDLLERTDLG